MDLVLVQLNLDLILDLELIWIGFRFDWDFFWIFMDLFHMLVKDFRGSQTRSNLNSN